MQKQTLQAKKEKRKKLQPIYSYTSNMKTVNIDVLFEWLKKKSFWTNTAVHIQIQKTVFMPNLKLT